MPIQRLLVANRGEIALRVFRTCRALGIETVAVAAPDDTASLHARSADATVEISNYLHSEEHIRAAREAGADSIHPGYGFLAESADFAEAVEAAGLTWIGPPPAALRLGGDKIAAKRIARDAGVPVLPDGAPEAVGFPLLVKAAAGGGGRGMRVVRSAAELGEALAAARARGRRRIRRRDALLRAVPRAPTTRRGAAPRRRARQRRRARRARLLGPATPPEGPRGSSGSAPRCGAPRPPARGRRRLRAGDRIPQRRHRRVRRGGRRLLLPGAERPHPGRASGDGGGHGPRPRRASDPDRRRRSPRRLRRLRMATRSRCASTPRIRGRFCPRPGRIERLRLPSGARARRLGRRGGRRDRPRLRPDDREARRAWLHTRRGARSPRACARRDGGRGRHDEPPVPPLARRAPGGPGRRCDHGVPDRPPAAHGATAPPPRRRLPRALAPEPPGAAAGAAA